MKTTSQFYKVNDNILLEYMYNSVSIPFSENTLELLYNSNSNEYYIYSKKTDTTQNQNILDNMCVVTNLKDDVYTYLNQDIVTPYNDFSDELTTTDLNFNNLTVKYDTIRLHIQSGFDFSSYSGFMLNAFVSNAQGNRINLTSFLFNKWDDYYKTHDDAFVVGEIMYSNYIDLLVPSTSWLFSETTAFTDAITQNHGFNTNTGIGIIFSEVRNRNKITLEVDSAVFQEYETLTFYHISRFSVPLKDSYEKLSASITEINDYFVLEPKYDDKNISNYISKLRTEIDGDWILLHDVTVYENVGDSKIPSASYSFIQESNWSEPYLFRPVIKNNTAQSFALQYNLRLFNRKTNQQVLKKSQLICTQPHRYGKKLTKINVGEVPVIDKIYNVTQRPNIVYERKTQGSVVYKEKYINTFFSNDNIYVSNGTNEDPEIELSNLNLKKQGDAVIEITDLDTYIKFVVYERKNDGVSARNLNGVGQLNLVFIKNNGDTIKFKNILDTEFDVSKGEIMFKVSQVDGAKIKTFKNRNFYITSTTEAVESTIYKGTWTSTEVKNLEGIADQNRTLQKEVQRLNKLINTLTSEIKNQKDKNAELTSSLNKLKDRTIELTDVVEEKDSKIHELSALDQMQDQKIALFQKQIKENDSKIHQQTEAINKLKHKVVSIKNFKYNPQKQIEVRKNHHRFRIMRPGIAHQGRLWREDELDDNYYRYEER